MLHLLDVPPPFLFHAFHGQADAAAFLVDVEDGDFDDVADGDDFGGVLDILTADLRDVDEAVLVDADVDEDAEVDDVADGAGQLHAGL